MSLFKHSNFQLITGKVWYKLLLMLCLVAGIFHYHTREINKNIYSAKVYQQSAVSSNKLSVYTVTNRLVENELIPTGKVIVDEEHVVAITSPVTGLVEQVKAEPGNYVKKGQVLALIRTENKTIPTQPISSQKAGQASQKKVTKAGRKYLPDKVDPEAGHSQIPHPDSMLTYTIKAPVEGFIVEKHISNGMVLNQNNIDNLFTISTLDKVWVLANVYQSDVDKIIPGTDASITTLAYPNQPFVGKVDQILSMPGQNSKVSKIRLTVTNTKHLLKPDMFASITINFTGHEQKPAIPAQAILFDKNKNFVIIYKDQNHLSVREVVIYKTLNGITYLASGIIPGETVVLKDQMPIYQALKK